MRQNRHWELFFDLVFVVAVAALATQLHADHSITGLVVFAGLFVPVWWGWMGYLWYIAAFGSGGVVTRLGVLAAMLAAAAMSAGVEGAAHGDSEGFVVAYACLLYVLGALYGAGWWRAPEARPLSVRFAASNALGATLWLSSLALAEDARPLVWATAMAVLIAAFVSAPGWVTAKSFHPSHVAERYGLFTLVVLGESIVVTVAGLETGSSLAAALVAIVGFILAATIWWLYFDLFRTMPVHRRATARFVWAQGHLLIFGGIAAAAVGIEFKVAKLARRAARSTRRRGVDVVPAPARHASPRRTVHRFATPVPGGW